MSYQSLQQIKRAIRDKYAWPGGYPMYLIMSDGGCLCMECARKEWRLICRAMMFPHYGGGWTAEGAEINWEDNELRCDHCGTEIEAAYGDQ